ncbi:MAG: M15 family metallopeptidase [Hyphomonadaceae bacterium]
MKRAYRDWPIDKTGTMVNEQLVRASDFGLSGRNHYAHDRNPPYWAKTEGAIDALLVRASVGGLLQGVDTRLRAEGLRLFLFDAWRPRAVQAYFHDLWMPAEVRRRHPDWDEAAVMAEVERYWAAPSASPDRPAPHATGGAVDITIAWADGEPLWMGSLFDDTTELGHTRRFEHEAGEASYSNREARANRRLLYWLMLEAGFASHPEEWWHYSYGDQMWAAHKRKAAALYGLAEPDPALLAP